jgi:hypothetical protein
MTPEMLRERDPRKLIPPLHGALLKNEQDVHLFERLAFLSPKRSVAPFSRVASSFQTHRGACHRARIRATRWRCSSG